MNPALVEVVKIVCVSVGWIGILAVFMWWKDRHKPEQEIPLSENKLQRSKAA